MLTKKEQMAINKVIKNNEAICKEMKSILKDIDKSTEHNKAVDLQFKSLELAYDGYTQYIFLTLGLVIGFSFNIGANLVYELGKEHTFMLWMLFLLPILLCAFMFRKVGQRVAEERKKFHELVQKK